MIPPRSTISQHISARVGFTLLELVMTLVILGIVGLTSGFVVTEAMRAYGSAEPHAEADYQLRLAFDRLVTDLRDLDDRSALSVVDQREIAFHRTDGVNIQYSWSGDELLRNGAAIATGVGSFELSYRDAGGKRVYNAAGVERIEVDLVLERAGGKYPLYTSVTPRALAQ